MSYSYAESSTQQPSPGLAVAAWHSLLWLVIGNAIGVMIAVLLLLPGLNSWLGEWTYGRWIMVHMNIALYGWSSLPMVGFLFHIYGADRGVTAAWCRPIVWAWSTALTVGCLMWLNGYSSGKLFLDWSGYARVLFSLALLALWVLLAVAFARAERTATISGRLAKLCGLLLLLAVPFALYVASNPNLYPAIDPDTGGPTGTSQLESSLAIVLILLFVPFGISRRRSSNSSLIAASWLLLAGESLLCATLTRTDVSHHSVVQIISVASVLVWLPLVPAYYAAFEWRPITRPWRIAFHLWWAMLVLTGVIMFLPGVLDHFKFTDGLVGHSFIAMAGFLSAFLIFVMVQLLDEGGWIFTRTWSFHLWNWSVLGYVVIVTIAGWFEGYDPAFTIVPGIVRNVLYVLRLISGALMLVASIEWLTGASTLLRQFEIVPANLARKKVA